MGESTPVPACCVGGCPCAVDGEHKGKPVFSATYGGQFCCRRSYVRRHYKANKGDYVVKATAWNKANPERRRIIQADYYLRNEDRKRDYWLTIAYGISLAEYGDMAMAQCGLCAVCGQPETRAQRGREQRLSVHHDHETGKVVALLCHNCNRGMGLLGDSAENLQRAADLQSGR